jgi:glyoxylase-like metal-dependent hydrolase (beta-lactamase superfamily II)/8-oxo-dGTP pyrophosphatase MutT (NUDIX family)
MSKIIDAVSVVLTCGDQIFAIQRQNFLTAFPGYWAFPGGKVEKNDSDYFLNSSQVNGLDSKLFGAVVREIKEELGIDLNQEIDRGTINSCHYLGLAVTPDFNPFRFATYFFKIELNKKIPFTVDTNEARVFDWMSAEALLYKYELGDLLAVPPVIKVIEILGKNPQTTHIGDLNISYDSTDFVPYIEFLKGIRQIMPLSHTLPPATRTNAFLIGDDISKKIIIDPSPRDEEEFRKFKNTLNLFGVDEILLTHHHPDHIERANELAREFHLKILLSEYTKNKILSRDPQYFNGVTTKLIKDGDIVTKWLHKDVLVMEVPGHDEGQVALYSQDLSWFIAGDLFQGVGTVVIGGDEGDMRKYFDTLAKIINLSPKVVFPSHGIGLGGTSILEKTLNHRREREAQVYSLYSEGLSPEEMLPKLYAEVDKALWPFALQNINKHLEKLTLEKRIKTT